MSQGYHVERNPNVDPLLFSCQEGVLCAVGKSHGAVPVPECPAIHDHTLSPHRRELAERLAGGVEQVLAVHEGDRALGWRFGCHWPIGKK